MGYDPLVFSETTHTSLRNTSSTPRTNKRLWRKLGSFTKSYVPVVTKPKLVKPPENLADDVGMNINPSDEYFHAWKKGGIW